MNVVDFAAPASVTGTANEKPPISQASEQLQLARDQAAGANVYSFDPEAPPEQKAQMARKAIPPTTAVDTSALPSLRGPELKEFKQAGGSEMATDIDSSGTQVPTTTDLTQVDALAIARDEGRIDDAGVPAPPGAMPAAAGKIREIPAWFAIGWTGQDKSLFLAPQEARARSILTDFISEAYYGQWWHNAGIIIFCVVASHFVTLFGGGWGWLLIILAFAATYYQTSIKRTTRNVRDDMTREVAKKGLKADVESATWLNLFMQRFWLIYEPVLSATIVASVDQVLSVSTPAFLDSIRMTTFTLGTKPPHIDHVRTFADTPEDIVMMEWKISFVPNDIANMTTAAAERKINPKIVLNIRFGVGPASVGKDIVVEDLSFQGTMRIKMKLMTAFPHVQLVDLSFMQPPVFDFVLKPVGFDLSIIPGLSPFITSQVHATLGPMMYAPNTFTLNLEQMLSGAPIDTACGVLALTIQTGRGLKGTKLGGGAPDPYVSVAVAGRAELARTAIKKSSTTPRWNETKYILLNNLNENLTMTIMDWNEHRPDADLGVASFDLKSLMEDGQQENVSSDVIYDGKARGAIKFDAVYYPVLKENKLPDGTVEPVPETKSGVVRLVIHQAKELDPRGQQINPFAAVSLNSKKIHQSQTLKRTPNPVWERPTEFLVTDKASAVISIQVMDDNKLLDDSKLGNVSVKLTDILDANAKGQDWFPLSNAKSGRIRLSAVWKPVLMAGAINGAGVYTPPIGVIRVHFKSAQDLKNVEALTGGRSDPYARVLRSGIVVTRTQVIDNNLSPVWDEIVYIQVHDKRDTFVIEVMDYQHMSKDRSLGVSELSVSDLLQEGTDKKNKPWVSTGKRSRSDPLRIDGKQVVKGRIDYDVEFFPCAPLRNVSFSEPENLTIAETTESSTATRTTNSSNSTSIENGVNGTSSTSKNDTQAATAEEEGIVIPREQLLRTQTGVLAFQIVSGQLSRRGARLEVLFDDGYWPAYSTEPARSPHAVWDEIGEAVIRELDYSHIILKLNSAEKETREDIIASLTVDMNEFLETCLDKPATFTLTDPNGGSRCTVTLACKYIPIDMQILARESINNSGNLRVELVDAKGVPAADRSGKSDPYAVFTLNDEKVHKSEVVKKTLAPVWNESFECAVASRVAAEFWVDIFDWDRVGSATKLGRARIDLASLEPMERADLTLPIVPHKDTKVGKEPPVIHIRVLFRPAFLIRSRKATSTFSAVGRVGTGVIGGVGAVGGGIAHAGGAVGKGAVHGVGTVGKGAAQGVGTVGRGVFGGIRKVTGGGSHARQVSVNSTTGEVLPSLEEAPMSAEELEVIASSSSAPDARQDHAAASISSPGTLSITVDGFSHGEDMSDKKFVVIKNGSKVVKETKAHQGEGDQIRFGDTAVVKTGETALDLSLSVVHKKTFGSDKPVGSCILTDLEDLATQPGAAKSIELPLVGGSGTLQLTLSWMPTGSRLDTETRSIAGSVSPSTRARSRFSTLGRRGREQSAEA